MSQESNRFAEDPGYLQRFQEAFRAQDVLRDAINDISAHHSDKLTLREGEERDLSLFLIASFFGKAQKTSQAVKQLCFLGYGEDALLLVRSNINLLINISFIFTAQEPITRMKEFTADSIQRRSKYLDTAYDGEYPEWMKKHNRTEIKELAKEWETNIKARAESMPALASLFHYQQGYCLYSSIEHSDVMAISGYVQDRDKPNYRITGPSDQYLDIALAHNFYVMTDLLGIVLQYFDIQRPDIGEQLTAAWEALEKDGA